MINVYEAQSANRLKSAIIMALFIVFVTASVYIISLALGTYFGYEPGGLGIAGIAFIFSGLTTLISYYASDKIVLAISSARPADRKRDFHFYTVAENLSIAAGLPKPKLYVIEDSAPNAFATGRDPDHAVICATTGLLAKLDRTELEGVIAHELSHIKNYDTRLMSIVAILVGMVALLADIFLRISFRSSRSDKKSDQAGAIFILLGIVFAILSPIVSQLIQLAVARRREFLADSSSVLVTRQPSGLISALEKIASDHEPLEAANKATAHLYIVNPFKEKGHGAVDWFSGLFNTHPPVSERIAALRKMA
jgi:heat shock protein HtpX